MQLWAGIAAGGCGWGGGYTLFMKAPWSSFASEWGEVFRSTLSMEYSVVPLPLLVLTNLCITPGNWSLW